MQPMRNTEPVQFCHFYIKLVDIISIGKEVFDSYSPFNLVPIWPKRRPKQTKEGTGAIFPTNPNSMRAAG
jgi:hypothetical protein